MVVYSPSGVYQSSGKDRKSNSQHPSQGYNSTVSCLAQDYDEKKPVYMVVSSVRHPNCCPPGGHYSLQHETLHGETRVLERTEETDLRSTNHFAATQGNGVFDDSKKIPLLPNSTLQTREKLARIAHTQGKSNNCFETIVDIIHEAYNDELIRSELAKMDGFQGSLVSFLNSSNRCRKRHFHSFLANLVQMFRA